MPTLPASLPLAVCFCTSHNLMAIEASDLFAFHYRIFVPAGCTSLTALISFIHLLYSLQPRRCPLLSSPRKVNSNPFLAVERTIRRKTAFTSSLPTNCSITPKTEFRVPRNSTLSVPGAAPTLVILFTIDALAAVIPSCAGLSDRRCIFWLALDRSAGAIRSKVDQLCKHPGNTSRDKAAFVLCFRQRQPLQTPEEAELMRRRDWPHPIQYFDNSHIYIYLLTQQRAASTLRHREM